MSNSRPFRFSLQVSHISSARAWVNVVREAESTGFDMIVTPQHLGGCPSPLVALASAAQVSARLRLGTMVLNNDFHHVALLARDAATLDVLSEGRFELGLGAGHAKPEYAQAGLTFLAHQRRVERIEEAVVLLRALLDGETVTHRGRHYHLAETRCDPRPLQAHVPVLVGGGGTKVLAVAARHADIVGLTGLGRTLPDGQHHEPSGFDPVQVDQQIAHVRQHAGTRIESIELQALVQAVVVTDHPESMAQELVSNRLPTLTPQVVLDTPYLMVGTTQSIMERLQANRERWGISHYTFREPALPAVAGIISELAGR